MTFSGKASVTKAMSATHDDLVPRGCHDPHKTPQKTRSPSSKDMFVSLPKDLTQDVPLGVWGDLGVLLRVRFPVPPPADREVLPKPGSAHRQPETPK